MGVLRCAVNIADETPTLCSHAAQAPFSATVVEQKVIVSMTVGGRSMYWNMIRGG
jgi:hypothetical protein